MAFEFSSYISTFLLFSCSSPFYDICVVYACVCLFLGFFIFFTLLLFLEYFLSLFSFVLFLFSCCVFRFNKKYTHTELFFCLSQKRARTHYRTAVCFHRSGRSQLKQTCGACGAEQTQTNITYTQHAEREHAHCPNNPNTHTFLLAL